MAKFKSEKPENAINKKYFVEGETRKTAPVRNKVTAGILSFFLGFLGVHQFYLKNTGKGIFCLLISLIMFIVFMINSLVSLDMQYLRIAFGIYELLLIIRGLIYIFQSDKTFKKKNKVRTF